MSNVFHSSSNSLHNSDLYLNPYYPESTEFLFSRHYVKRKRHMKLALRAIATRYDNVKNDYFFTFFNEKKTFLTLNTAIVKSLFKLYRYFPLAEIGLLRRRIKGLFVFQRHLLFTSHRALRFRNITIKLKSLKKQFSIVGSKRFVKPLNKALFFTLFVKLKFFSFRLPCFIRYRFWRKKTLRIYYLGFRFRAKNNRLRFKSSYLNRFLVLNKLTFHRRPRLPRNNNHYRKRLRAFLLRKRLNKHRVKRAYRKKHLRRSYKIYRKKHLRRSYKIYRKKHLRRSYKIYRKKHLERSRKIYRTRTRFRKRRISFIRKSLLNSRRFRVHRKRSRKVYRKIRVYTTVTGTDYDLRKRRRAYYFRRFKLRSYFKTHLHMNAVRKLVKLIDRKKHTKPLLNFRPFIKKL